MAAELLDPVKPVFPDPDQAMAYPDGLLAVGGNLQPDTLRAAYRQGIFPWFDRNSPICWWSPDPREVMLPGQQHWSRSMRRFRRNSSLRIASNRAFEAVMRSCSRADQESAWITEEMIEAYLALHRIGLAHSLEAWDGEVLVGGLYGVQVGGVFCGESMFQKHTNASKLVLLTLADSLFSAGCKMIDCQFATEHLRSLGSRSIARTDYLRLLAQARNNPLNWNEVFADTMQSHSNV